MRQYTILKLLCASLIFTFHFSFFTSAQAQTTQGTDFWAVFLDNKYEGYDCDFSFVATGPDDAIIRVENPVHGWDTTVYLRGGGVSYIHVPLDMAIPPTVGSYNSEAPFGNGFHVSTTAPVSLYASDYSPYSYDIATILPTTALQTRYIAQSYSGHWVESMVAFAATEDSTVLTMRLPCPTNSHQSGEQLEITLRRGEAVTLRTGSLPYNDGKNFNGMEVTSNGHPFAMFNGVKGDIGTLDYLDGYGEYEWTCMAGDHCYEQALPVEKWGRSYLLASPATRSGGEWVVVTSLDDSCLLRLDGDSLTTLQRDSTFHLWLHPDTVQLLTASQPVCATLFFSGGSCSNNIGDPSSVTLPPLEQATNAADFYSITTEGVTDHFVNITATASAVPYITLDGQPIGDRFTPYNSSISHARLHIGTGAHQLRTSHGSFTAWFYGLGFYESYTYTAAMALRPQLPHLIVDGNEEPQFTACQGDTVLLTAFSPMGDTVARWTIDGEPINDSTVNLPWCFTTPGTHCVTALMRGSCIVGWCDTASGCIVVNPSPVTVLPDTVCTSVPCLWHGVEIDTTGLYADTLRTAAGCDSIVRQRVVVEGIRISADRSMICEGDTVHIIVVGVNMPQWHSSPPDASLAGQESAEVWVTPGVTTTYWIEGVEDLAVTVEVLPSPQPCITVAKNYIDYDNPVLDVTDCSTGATSCQWLFSDGTTLTSPHVRRHLHQPLPDSLGVTLQACNSLHCCADTTLWLPLKIQSVWFPNIIAPGTHEGGFGCWTSLDVDVFELVVYNRWGMVVWSTDDVDARWDGAGMPQGSYAYRYYIHSITGHAESGIGTVTILR